MTVADEFRKAAYLREYRSLCMRHGLMVIQIKRDVSGEEYFPFCVLDVETDSALLLQAVEEMLTEDLPSPEPAE